MKLRKKKLKKSYKNDVFKLRRNINELIFFQISKNMVFRKLEGFSVAGSTSGSCYLGVVFGFPAVIFGQTPPVDFDPWRAGLILDQQKYFELLVKVTTF